MRMTRLWMTGCMALVLLAAGRWLPRDDLGEDGRGRLRVALSSRHGLNEAVDRIERLARQRGLVVMARAPAKGLPDALGVAGERQARVLVLGDANGRTPALQREGQAVPELPWQVVVSQRADGGTDIWLPPHEAWSDTLPEANGQGADVSPDTVRRLQALPADVRAALA
jgi:uncharacterized protein (DUF302 family)